MIEQDLLKKIESIIKASLKKLSKIDSDSKGYMIDLDGQITGLSLYLIDHEKIKRVLAYLKDFKNLTILNLSANNIKDISLLENLNNLEELYLSHNQIQDISSLRNLRKLKYIHLGGNQIKNISYLEHLTELIYLNLSHNRISYVPQKNNHFQMTKLDLSHNNIAELPSWISDFSIVEKYKWPENLFDIDIPERQLIISDNPVTSPPLEILKQGKEAIINYFDQYRIEVKDYLFEAKLILVGEERAGKTTIADALRNSDFRIEHNQSSTHGINIQTWIVPAGKIGNTKFFRFNIWDFGGQEIYHATHQFFLTKRSLYLFITEARKDLRYDDFYYWLNIINTLAGDSPVIIIQNKVDQDHKNANIDEYRKIFPQIIYDLQSISCNTDHTNWETLYRPSLRMLQENIYSSIKESKLHGVGDALPQSWVTIRHEINQLQLKGINYITEQVYFEICADNGLNKQQSLYLSDYFHDLGVFLHFRNDIFLKNTIFVNHEWVTKAIYMVFDNNKIKDSNGKFTESDLIDIWNSPDYSNRRGDLLNLMKNPQFKICYEKENHTYLAPQLFSSKPMKYEWRTTLDNRFLRYNYLFMPKGILSQLIVLMHNKIYKDTFWLHGVLFHYKDTRAIIKEDRFGKKNLITIQVEGIAKKELLSIIAANIETINNSYTNLDIAEEYGCCCAECNHTEDPHFYPNELINRALEKNKSIQCPLSMENVDTGELLGNFIPKTQLNFKNLEISTYFTTDKSFQSLSKLSFGAKSKTTYNVFLASSEELSEERKEFRNFISLENDRLNDDNIYLKLKQAEYTAKHFSSNSSQEELNNLIETSDIFVCLFFTKIGKYTVEEFYTAIRQFKESGKPLIFIYFKKANIDSENISLQDVKAKKALQDKLKAMGHYYSLFYSIDDLKIQFKSQLEISLKNI